MGYSHLNFSMFDDLQEIPDGSRDSATRKFTKQITENDLFRPVVSDVELNSYKIATYINMCSTTNCIHQIILFLARVNWD